MAIKQKKGKDKQPVFTFLDKDILKKVDKEAEELGISRSGQIALIIKKHFKESKKSKFRL